MQELINSPKIRILLVDDHIVMRMGLVTATSAEPDMEVVAECDNGLDAIDAYRRHRPDVVVLDLRMPKRGGIDTIQLLREEFGQVRVLVFSNYASGDDVYQAFKVGAAGFVIKEMAPQHLLDGIRRVHAGEQYVPPDISARMANRVLSQLSTREAEVLALVAKGQSNKEIAATLHLVESTVKVHLSNILSKLGVADRTQAVLAAFKRGILEME